MLYRTLGSEQLQNKIPPMGIRFLKPSPYSMVSIVDILKPQLDKLGLETGHLPSLQLAIGQNFKFD